MKRAWCFKLEVASFGRRQKTLYVRRLYLHLHRTATFFIVLNCEENKQPHQVGIQKAKHDNGVRSMFPSTADNNDYLLTQRTT
jgi:hypothetical protein